MAKLIPPNAFNAAKNVAFSDDLSAQSRCLFVGIDLAPNTSLESGLCAIDRNRQLLRVDKLFQDHEITAFINGLKPANGVIVVITMAKNLIAPNRWRVEQIRSRMLIPRLSKGESLGQKPFLASVEQESQSRALFPGRGVPSLLPQKTIIEDEDGENDVEHLKPDEEPSTKHYASARFQSSGRFGRQTEARTAAEEADTAHERFNRRAKLIADSLKDGFIAEGGKVLLTFSHVARNRYHLFVPFRSRSQAGCRLLQMLIAQTFQIQGLGSSQYATSVLDAMISAYTGWLVYAGEQDSHYRTFTSADGYLFIEPIEAMTPTVKRRRLKRRPFYSRRRKS
jgi:hypothetical protein